MSTSLHAYMYSQMKDFHHVSFGFSFLTFPLAISFFNLTTVYYMSGELKDLPPPPVFQTGCYLTLSSLSQNIRDFNVMRISPHSKESIRKLKVQRYLMKKRIIPNHAHIKYPKRKVATDQRIRVKGRFASSRWDLITTLSGASPFDLKLLVNFHLRITNC